jgi:hypothetical protein
MQLDLFANLYLAKLPLPQIVPLPRPEGLL